MSADHLERDFNNRSLEVRGNVKIVYDGQYLSADLAVINEPQETLTLRGNVVIASQQAYVEGREAVLNYRDNTGVFYDAFVKSGPVVFEGSVIRKTGDKSYVAENAFYTACDTCPPSWSFSGRKIDAELGGYAAITRPLFRVGNVPVFWFPYLVVPLKSERQTGFLVPKFEYTAGNPGFGIPFFWAISRSQDATFTFKTYTQRGFKGHVNYRYMLDEKSEGELNAAVIRDKTFADEQGGDIGAKRNRWFLSYMHGYELPYDFSQRVKLNLSSDLSYARDFPSEMEGQADPALENRVSLSRDTEITHSSVEIDYYLNQLKRNAITSNRDAVHRWPEVRFSVRDTPVLKSNLLFRFNANYVNFAREDYAFDDVFTDSNGRRVVDSTRSNPASNPGVFDPSTDLIRAGQRFDLMPELSYPFRIGSYFDVVPTIQARHTQYSFNLTPPATAQPGVFDPTPYRHYIRAEVSARTRFYTVFGPDAEPGGPPEKAHPDRYRHEVVPEVVVAALPYSQQASSPFFGGASRTPVFLNTAPIEDNDFQNSDARGVQFDYNDRVINRNTVSLVMNNRLVRKRETSGSPVYLQIVWWKLGQTFDIDENRKDGETKYPWSNIYSLLDVRMDSITSNTEVRYFPYHRVANTTARLRLNRDRSFIGANFIQTFRINANLDDTPQTQEVGMEFGFNTNYLKFAGVVALTPSGIDLRNYGVKSYGTEVIFKPPGGCWGIGFLVKQLIGDKITFDLAFDYNFGGPI